MRFYLQALLLIAYLVVVGPFIWAGEIVAPVVALDSKRVAREIRLVENWDGKSVGDSGEVGPWQFLPTTWKQFSDRPIWWASSFNLTCQAEQERVAIAEVEWIRARLPRLGLSESAWAIGLVHNAGYGRVRRRQSEPRHRAFADRVREIYEAR